MRMQICHDIVAPPSACHNKLAMRLAVSPRGMLALLLATVIAGALLVCSTVVQSNIQTFIGPNGTEYVALQWATQLQWQPPPGPVVPPDDFGADIDDWTGWASWSDAGAAANSPTGIRRCTVAPASAPIATVGVAGVHSSSSRPSNAERTSRAGGVNTWYRSGAARPSSNA